MKWALALGTPLVLAKALYWWPIWSGRSDNVSEYSAWELLFVTVLPLR